MNLIVLYGPPGSGKFTLGKKLSKYYSYTLLHNHAIFELANSALDKNSDSYWDFCWNIREAVICEGINENLSGMIMTRAGTGLDNEIKFFSKIKGLIEESKGILIIVKISCSMETLNNRVKEESRKQFTKVQDEDSLRKWFDRYQDRVILSESDEVLVENNTTEIQETVNVIISALSKKGISSK